MSGAEDVVLDLLAVRCIHTIRDVKECVDG